MGKYEIAVYGLGVMGASLAKNLIGKGFKTALYGKSVAERERFDAGGGEWQVFDSPQDMLLSLNSPKIVFMMVTAGKVVDLVIEELLPYLKAGDILIDGGNSYFTDTSRRYNELNEKGIAYLGVGVSGGEKGALTGPSMMAGGSLDGWNSCKAILMEMAAKADGESCCGYVGREGAGHYVKMVHNGIEYAIIQLLADCYYIMKNGLSLANSEIRDIFASWKDGRLNSYLVDIIVDVLSKNDEDGSPLVEKILDVAHQKGTGSWTLQEAIARGVYIPSICESVFTRFFSAETELRHEGAKTLKATAGNFAMANFKDKLEDALFAGIIMSYAQGIELIEKASADYGWDIDIIAAVKLWREGCIIRSTLLKDIVEALGEKKRNILLSKRLSYIGELEPALRETCVSLVTAGIAAPTFLSSIQYYDSLRAEKMSVNMVQALRDCFGAHTYERIDKKGSFHTEWN